MRGGLQLSDGVVEHLGQFDAIAYDALHLSAEELDGRRPCAGSLQSEQGGQGKVRGRFLGIGD